MGGWKRWHYDVQIKVWIKKGAIMMCNLKGQMGK